MALIPKSYQTRSGLKVFNLVNDFVCPTCGKIGLEVNQKIYIPPYDITYDYFLVLSKKCMENAKNVNERNREAILNRERTQQAYFKIIDEMWKKK